VTEHTPYRNPRTWNVQCRTCLLELTSPERFDMPCKPKETT